MFRDIRLERLESLSRCACKCLFVLFPFLRPDSSAWNAHLLEIGTFSGLRACGSGPPIWFCHQLCHSEGTYWLILTHLGGTVFASRIGTSTRYCEDISMIISVEQATHLDSSYSHILQPGLLQDLPQFGQMLIQLAFADVDALNISSYWMQSWLTHILGILYIWIFIRICPKSRLIILLSSFDVNSTQECPARLSD
jgi:hypothetical protein